MLDHVFDRMKVDAEWSIRRPGEFTWWAGPLAQRVWCDPPRDDLGVKIHRIHARTDVATGYAGTEKQLALLGSQSRMATISAFVRDPKDRKKIQLACSINVHDQTEQWLSDLMSWVCSIQVTEAHLNAPILSTMGDCQLAASDHPQSGAREDLDDMLNIIEQVVAPAGANPSAWVCDEMEKLVGILQRPPCVMVTGDESGLTAELPFGQQTSLLRVMAGAKNPRMGNGCLVTLTLPAQADAGTGSSRWLELNELEERSFVRSHLLGSWCPDDRGPTFVQFLPNALYRPGTLTNLVMTAVGRAKWATETVYGFDMQSDFTGAIAKKEAMLTEFLSRSAPAKMPWWKFGR